MAEPKKEDTVQRQATGTFIKGAAILGVAAVLVKVMGAIFRIPLGNLIGDTGMGYYQTAYPIYNFLLVISTAGIPTAIAKITSEKLAVGDIQGSERVFAVTYRMMMVVGVVMSLCLLLGAKWMVTAVNNPKAYWSVVTIAPSVFFVSMMAVYRGYFQGHQKMEAFAGSQLAEQFGRVVLGLVLVVLLLPRGVEFASAGATFGASIGGLSGFLFIVWRYRKHHKTLDVTGFGTHRVQSASEILKNLLMIAIPITIGASIMPVMTLFDLGIVLNRLVDAGFTEVRANELYGQLTGYAQTLVNLPQVLTAAIQISIVPAVSHFVTLGDKKNTDHTIETGMRLALIIGLPCAVGLSILAEPIMRLLYPMQQDIAGNTGAILAILGIGIIFLSFFQVTTGVLQGLGKQKVPAYNLFFGALVKLVLSYTLVGIPALNVMGAAWATVAAFAVAAVLNFFSLRRYAQMEIRYTQIFVKPTVSVAVMGAVVWGVYAYLGSRIPGALATVTAIGIGGIVFFGMLFATKALTEADLEMLPGGGKIKRLLGKKQK